MRVTRRSILRGIGVGTATLFARPLLEDAFAKAAGLQPRRLLVLCMPNCSVKVDWEPKGGRNVLSGSGDATQFTFNYCNEPLTPVKEYVNIVHGLDHKRMGGDPHGGGFLRYTTGGHIQQGETTGDPGAGRLPGDGNMPKLPSIDQLLIKKSPMIGDPSLPIKGGLQLALNTRGRTDGVHFITLSYSVPEAGGKPQALRPENVPYRTYARVVELAAPTSSMGGAEAQGMVTEQLRRDKSVIDFVKADVERLQGRLGTVQKKKLESHLTGLREYEQSLEMRATAGPRPPVNVPKTIEPIEAGGDFAKIFDQYHDLAKLAFQLDLVRTATILYGHGNQAWNGIHGRAHGGGWRENRTHTRAQMQMLAGFIQRCAAVVDFDGSKLIDNMVITLSSDVGEQHSHTNVPYLVCGGKNMGIKGGRALTYMGRASNDVFSTLAKPLGLELEGGKFGDPHHAQGPLPEFL
jgi:Protein of unknown function (DUF1552)